MQLEHWATWAIQEPLNPGTGFYEDTEWLVRFQCGSVTGNIKDPRAHDVLVRWKVRK